MKLLTSFWPSIINWVLLICQPSSHLKHQVWVLVVLRINKKAQKLCLLKNEAENNGSLYMVDKSDFDIARWLLPFLFKNSYVHTFAYFG